MTPADDRHLVGFDRDLHSPCTHDCFPRRCPTQYSVINCTPYRSWGLATHRTGASCVELGSNVFKRALNNSHVFSGVAMTQQIKHLYEFGPYRIDAAKRVLLRGEAPVQLPSKVFETLLVLVQRSEEVVSKDDLLKTVWPDSFVEESNLSQSIFLLRKALG